MRLFITGGTGFIGQATCKALEGHELLVLTRDAARASFLQPIQVLAGTLNEPSDWSDAVERFRPDACIHLAWEGLPDYSMPICQRNFTAGLSLFRILKDMGCTRTVVTGTCFEYGTLTGCLKETDIPATANLFPTFKTALLLAGKSLFDGDGTSLIWTRPFFVYGSKQRSTSLLPSAFRALKAGETPAIQTPNVINDFVHVDDVAAGIAHLATGSAPSGVYNLGSGVGTRVRDAVNALARVLGVADAFAPSDEVGQGFWANMQQMEEVAGWRPQLSLEVGIRRTVEGWRDAA